MREPIQLIQLMQKGPEKHLIEILYLIKLGFFCLFFQDFLYEKALKAKVFIIFIFDGRKYDSLKIFWIL